MNDHIQLIFNYWKEFIQTIEIEDNYKVLDVGAGDGRLTRLMNEEKVHCMGMDIKPADTVKIKGKMEDLPFHSNVFHMIMCSHTFEHTIDPIGTIKEFHRVTIPRGLVFLATPYPTKRQYYSMDETHNFVLNTEQIRALFEKNNFFSYQDPVILKAEKDSPEDDWTQVNIFVRL